MSKLTNDFLNQANIIEEQIELLRKSCYKIQNIEGRIAQIHCKPDDELVSINISNTVIELSKQSALDILSKAMEQERKYAQLMMWRMDKAYSYLSGEYDKDMEL